MAYWCFFNTFSLSLEKETDEEGNDKIVVYLLSIYEKSDTSNISIKNVALLDGYNIN